jgi:hypothetical protein
MYNLKLKKKFFFCLLRVSHTKSCEDDPLYAPILTILELLLVLVMLSRGFFESRAS